MEDNYNIMKIKIEQLIHTKSSVVFQKYYFILIIKSEVLLNT